jgi:2'-5' RNA ligase
VRLFVALVPPDEVVEDLAEFLGPRQEAPEASAMRWTAPDQWHVTLAFMGDVADRHLDELAERLGRAAARRSPLELTITGGGAFPNVGRAKVLYAGLDADGRDADLRHLAVGTRAAATKAGADAEGGRFRAHVTIARVGRPFDVTRWVRVLDAYRGPAWTADEVSLVQSHLGEGPRRRPRYEVLETFPLGR